MATVSQLGLGEKIALPFSALIPAAVGFLGYLVWKRDLKRDEGETMTARMSAWFMASHGILTGMAIFHSLLNIAFSPEPRIGLLTAAVVLGVGMCIKMHFGIKWVENEDLLFNARNEVSPYVMMDSHGVREHGAEFNNQIDNNVRRKLIASLVYVVIAFESAFDGLVLKYNPNAMDPGVQVAMFFVAKFLESVVISSALIHAAVPKKWYVFYICSFTVTVGASTLAAYDLVPSNIPVMVFEHWALQIALGICLGIMLLLAFYFAYLETRRRERENRRPWLMTLTFLVGFTGSVASGIFG